MNNAKASNEGLELIAIVHPGVQISEIDHQTLQDIYTGQLEHWPDGQRIQPILRPIVKESAYRFYRDVLEMGPEKLQAHWQNLMIAGERLPFKVIHRAYDTGTFVAQKRGSIAIVERRELSQLVDIRTRVVQILKPVITVLQ
tara:strand:+ start:508 stop:933 length:426 start_codon:yes stop_codon:yes gene_type:complete